MKRLVDKYESSIHAVLEAPPTSPELEARFREYGDRISVWFVRLMCWGTLITSLITWPSDFMLFGDYGAAFWAVTTFRIAMILGSVALLYLSRYTPWGQRQTKAIFASLVIAATLVTGYMVALSGGFTSSLAFGVYALPFCTVILTFSLAQRIIWTSLMPIAYFTGLFGHSPQLLVLGSVGSPLVFAACCVVASVILGHAVCVILRANHYQKVLLEQRTEELEALDRLKDEFLSTASHELRTPLNGIMGLTHLAMQTELAPEQRQYLNLVQLSADNLLDLINDILDFSKLEAGQLDAVQAEFPLRDQLAFLVQQLAVRASEKGITFRVRVGAEVPDSVVGDLARFRQILNNLVGNAIKFTDSGEVRLNLNAQAGPGDQLTLEMAVSDTGVGIPEDQRERIFEPFSQVEGFRTRDHGGTGLGLAITSHLVQILGGRISLESRVGEGSTFHVTLKCRPGRPGPITIPAPLGQTLLVLSADEGEAAYIAEAAANLGFEAFRAEGWPADAGALHALLNARDQLDYVLFDLEDGSDAVSQRLARLRQDPRLEKATWVALSPSPISEDEKFSGAIAKPTSFNRLGKTIADLDEPESELPSVIVEPTYSPIRVLVVDDNAANRLLATKLLQKRGHSVTVATTGPEALVAYARKSFDLVLMDVQMPGMDGVETATRIRNVEAKRAMAPVPIVAVTAHAMRGDRERFLRAGMDDYVSKPIRPGQLFGIIDRLSPASRSSVAAETVRVARVRIAPPAPSLDLEKILIKLGGDGELLAELADLVRETLPRQIQALDAAVKSGNPQHLARAAHDAAGSVAPLFQTALTDGLRNVERESREGDPAAAGHRYLALRPGLQQLLADLDGFGDQN